MKEEQGRQSDRRINWGFWGPMIGLIGSLMLVGILAWIGSSMTRPIKTRSEIAAAAQLAAQAAAEESNSNRAQQQSAAGPGSGMGIGPAGGPAAAGSLLVGALGLAAFGAALALCVLWVLMPYLIYRQLVALGEIKKRIISLEERFCGTDGAPSDSRSS